MRPIMVAGNWKMNGLSADAVHLTQAILHAEMEPMRPEVVIFPPFILKSVSGGIQGQKNSPAGCNLVPKTGLEPV